MMQFLAQHDEIYLQNIASRLLWIDFVLKSLKPKIILISSIKAVYSAAVSLTTKKTNKVAG